MPNGVYRGKFLGLIKDLRQFGEHFWSAESPSNTQQTSGRSATVVGKTNVTKVEELIEITYIDWWPTKRKRVQTAEELLKIVLQIQS